MKNSKVLASDNVLIQGQVNYLKTLRYNELHDRLVQESEDECIVTAKEISCK